MTYSWRWISAWESKQLAQKMRKKQHQLRECTKTLGQHKEGKVLRFSPEKARKLCAFAAMD